MSRIKEEYEFVEVFGEIEGIITKDEENEGEKIIIYYYQKVKKQKYQEKVEMIQADKKC